VRETWYNFSGADEYSRIVGTYPGWDRNLHMYQTNWQGTANFTIV